VVQRDLIRNDLFYRHKIGFGESRKGQGDSTDSFGHVGSLSCVGSEVFLAHAVYRQVVTIERGVEHLQTVQNLFSVARRVYSNVRFTFQMDYHLAGLVVVAHCDALQSLDAHLAA